MSTCRSPGWVMDVIRCPNNDCSSTFNIPLKAPLTCSSLPGRSIKAIPIGVARIAVRNRSSLVVNALAGARLGIDVTQSHDPHKVAVEISCRTGSGVHP